MAVVVALSNNTASAHQDPLPGPTNSVETVEPLMEPPTLLDGQVVDSGIDTSRPHKPALSDFAPLRKNFEPHRSKRFGYIHARTKAGNYITRVGGKYVSYDAHPYQFTSVDFNSSLEMAVEPECTDAGHRFVIIYAYAMGTPNEYEDNRQHLEQIVAANNGKLVNESLLASNGVVTRSMRVHCFSPTNKVIPVAIPQQDCLYNQCQAPSNIASYIEETLTYLAPAGNNSGESVKYLIFYDGDPGYADTGYGWTGPAGSQSDVKSIKNINRMLTTSAVIYRPRWETLNVLHEMMHTVGAVQFSAPNASQYGHCYDGIDIMCYWDSDSSLYNEDSCSYGTRNGAGVFYGSSEGIPLDCGYNDYFNTLLWDKSAYLNTHWNTGGLENDYFNYGDKFGKAFASDQQMYQWHKDAKPKGPSTNDLRLLQLSAPEEKFVGSKLFKIYSYAAPGVKPIYQHYRRTNQDYYYSSQEKIKGYSSSLYPIGYALKEKTAGSKPVYSAYSVRERAHLYSLGSCPVSLKTRLTQCKLEFYAHP